MEAYDNLNPQQKEAVTAGDGQILVLAGPGSGKTRVLTQRIVFLMKNAAVRPNNILAVTFTNKAAKEMQARVESTLNASVQGSMWIGTFHSICARILRRESTTLPFDNNFVIMDADDQLALVKRIIKNLNLDDKTYRPYALHSAISKSKNDLQFPADLPRSTYREEALFRVYEQYQKHLQDSNALDFDDLLLWTYKLLKENKAVREQYGKRFQHILVDEFQDTNIAQYQLLRSLAEYHGNIFVVGDEDQSIYRWRGADYRNILLFEKDYPSCQKILLEQNYRSTQNVLDAAQGVISQNHNRTKKNLFSDRGCGDKIIYYEAPDDRMEAQYVAETIQTLMDNGNARGGDFAVLYRTNAQSRLLEDAFLYRGMSYRLVGAQRFYGRREIKDIIAFLRLIFNPLDEISLSRVINVPPRGIGQKSVQTLLVTAAEAAQMPGTVLLDLGAKGPDSQYWPDMGRAALPLADFSSLLHKWRRASQGGSSIVSLIDMLLSDLNYRAFLDSLDEEDDDRWENVEEFRKMAFEYEDRGLAEFLQNLALVSDQDTIAEQVNVPTLLTLHSVKGLEFNRVFIVGLDEGLLPHSRSLDDPEEMAEERRLFYVGITRAKNQVTLVRANRRISYGMPETMVASRFIFDIPTDLMMKFDEDKKSVRKSDTRWESRPAWARPITNAMSAGKSVYAPPTPKAPTKETTQMFKALDKVKHPLWGEGTVLESKISDDEEVLDVQFKSVGLKRLIASMSKLTKI